MNEALLAVIRATITDETLRNTLIAKLTETKLSIRTAEEETQFKANLLATVDKEEIIKDAKKAWMTRIEDDIRETTGLKQNPSEPYHEFMKRGIKSLQDKVTELDTEKKKLEALKNGDGDGVWKAKYETLEQQSKQALAAKDQAMEGLQKTVESNSRRLELDKVFAPLKSKFIDTLPSFFGDYQEQVINDLLAKSAMIDGKLVLVDEAGNPRKDNNLNNITAESFLQEKFKEVIKVDKTQPGGGTKPPDTTKAPAPSANEPFNPALIGADVDSEGKLVEALGKQGLLQGTEEFDKAFQTTLKEKNITKIF